MISRNVGFIDLVVNIMTWCSYLWVKYGSAYSLCATSLSVVELNVSSVVTQRVWLWCGSLSTALGY